MPYIQAAPPRWAKEPMVIKFWEHLRSSPPVLFSLLIVPLVDLAHGSWLITMPRRKKASFASERFAGGGRCEGCDREQDAQEFLWIFFIAPESRVKRGKARDMARSRSEEGKVLSFLFFFRLLMELVNFSTSTIFGLPLIQADFYAITITSFSSSISNLSLSYFDKDEIATSNLTLY